MTFSFSSFDKVRQTVSTAQAKEISDVVPGHWQRQGV
jgi:hypothetical protein